MDTNSIIQIINSVGFPIVAAGALFWREVTQGRQMKEAIDNNTLIITKLISKWEEGEK